MTEKRRRRFSAAYKAKMAEAAIRERRNTAELAQQHRVHSNQVSQWKREALAAVSRASRVAGRASRSRETVLLAKIGGLQMRIDELEGQLPDVLRLGRWLRRRKAGVIGRISSRRSWLSNCCWARRQLPSYRPVMGSIRATCIAGARNTWIGVQTCPCRSVSRSCWRRTGNSSATTSSRSGSWIF